MKNLTVKCPGCQKEVIWGNQSPDRPFCSERCKLIDLGEWADENRSIPADAEHDDVTASDLGRD